MLSFELYLFGKRVHWGKVSVTLAVNCRSSTATNGIHLPVRVVIVHHMEIAMPTSAINYVVLLLVQENMEYNNHDHASIPSKVKFAMSIITIYVILVLGVKS